MDTLLPSQDGQRMQADGQPSIKTADGWLVCLAKRARFDKRWVYDAEYCEFWEDALDHYENPRNGWQATAIHACKDGEPFAKLSAYRIAQLRHD